MDEEKYINYVLIFMAVGKQQFQYFSVIFMLAVYLI
jgi:hypothetical protein